MSQDFTIRAAVVADAQQLSSLAAAVFPLGCPPETRQEHLAAFIESELTPDRFREYVANPGIALFVAEIRGELIGYTMLVRGSAHPQIAARSPVELCKLYVVQAQHGRGVADGLMRHAMRFIESGGHDAAWLSVSAHNNRAIAFYQRWGFESVGTHYFIVGEDRQKDFLMQWDDKRLNVAREGPR